MQQSEQNGNAVASDGRGQSTAPAAERVLEQLVSAMLDEQRRARRWRIFFRFFWVLLAVIGLALVVGREHLGGPEVSSDRHTALIDLTGVIEAKGEISAANVNEALRAAFKDHDTAGVILRINSPGGSPVQAGIIHDEILRLRAKHPDTPLYVVVEEICASGGYYIASAADRIYVDKASLVGSIGVLMDGFGFTGAMDKLGVERRLLTAGRNKGFLDSFSPLQPEQRAYAQQMLDDIHRQFIEVVKKGRGDRLKESPDLFSGLVWTGERSVELGLADALGTVDYVAREVIKAEDLVDYSPHENLAERLAKRVGASAGRAMASLLQSSVSTPQLH
jgi:protease IV